MGMPQFIFFDLGNVLLRFDHQRACRQLAEAAGLTPEVVRQVVFDEGVQWRYERGEIDCREFYEHFCRRTHTRVAFAQVELAASAIFEVNVPILPIVAGLSETGRRLGVLSNTCAAHWRYCRSRYAVLGFFDVFALSFEIGAMKPDAKTYLAAAALAGAAPEEIFFTDDRPENVLAARCLGFDAVPYTTPAHLAAELRTRGVELNY